VKTIALWKLLAIWFGGWLFLAAIFVAYRALNAESSGFPQRSAVLVAKVAGFIFGLGLVGIMGLKFGGLFQKRDTGKTYYDELSK
jgi:hypothetical protein